MTFDYPRIGSKYDPATHTWNERFPETPKGFSGGAVFGIVKRPGHYPMRITSCLASTSPGIR